MITNLDKYIDVLEGRSEHFYCYLYRERTREEECVEHYRGECKDCIKDTVKWLLEEYKGELLSDKEREYLKMVIAPHKNLIFTVCKDDSIVTIYRYYYYAGNDETVEAVFMNIPVSDEMPFQMLEDGKKYERRVLHL